MKWLGYPDSLTAGYANETLYVMLNLSSYTADIIAFLFQMIAVYIVIIISLLNLTQGTDNKELWVSLLSSSVGYLLPTPILTKKHVSGFTE